MKEIKELTCKLCIWLLHTSTCNKKSNKIKQVLFENTAIFFLANEI